MTLFPAQSTPRVFALPPRVDFSRALVAGLEARLAGQPPEAMVRVEIWTNTRRAARGLTRLFAEGPPRLLPRIRVVTELADDPLLPVDLPAPVPALRRKLELARLVAGLAAAEPELAAGTAVFDLADSLAELLDEMQGEGVSPAAFATLDVAEHAAHWQRSLRFLTLITGYLAAIGPGDGQGRLRAAAQALAAAWAERPPGHPIIVAGSTGSRGATRAFMAAVARLPQGALVLPGFDATLPRPVWDRLGADDAGAADHPQHGFRRLADALGFDPAAVPLWHPVAPPAPARNALVSLALRPAPVTDQWRSEGAALAGHLGAACEGLAWVEAPDPRGEALAIALRLREAAEAGERAALVTPDRGLARRVTAELDRWAIIPDDSAGRPLSLTPPGVLLRRLAALPGAPLTPEDLLVLLKHPLVDSAPGARGAHLRLTSMLERKHLRGGPPFVAWAALRAWAAEAGEDAPAWIAWIEAALAPLTPGVLPLAEHVVRHRAAAEALAAGPAASPAHVLWDEDAGLQARALLDALAAEAEAAAPLDAAEYRALFQSLIAARDVPEAAPVTHPGVAIWGTLEARVQSADLVILGGLNEGTWPRLPGADPWLGRAMRRALGLPSPEARVGLSAHDFQQATGAPRVVLSRATRDAEAPTVASRWLLRLENLLLGLGPEGKAALAAAKARGARLLADALRLDRPAAPAPPARRPAPRPPLAARPTELSVTQLERLVRDPYGVYAEKVLGLRKLKAPGRLPDALTRGNAIHAALDRFLAATEAGLPADAEPLFAATVRDALAEAAPWPSVNAIWSARLARAARWFLDGEAERRARGAPAAREVKGRRDVGGLKQPFAVTARADRIDRLPGGFAIYDYKSGSNPSAAEARAFYLQLPLEAAILAASGFEGLEAGPALHLELLKFGKQGETLPLDADPATLSTTWARLRALLAHYLDEANGFPARLRPQRLTWGSDYDHLSRKGEWADGDDWEDAW
jgi:ATP-dependent helicase/nuclease subunit B